MKLVSIEYLDKITGWKTNKICFESLTLLVGASGVGKTKILEAIGLLPAMMSGASFNGIGWNAEFADEEGKKLIWSGETDIDEESCDIKQIPIREIHDSFPDVKNVFQFSKESIIFDGKEIAKRDTENIIFDGKKTVKLERNKSLFYLLREENLVADLIRRIAMFQRIDGHFSGVISSIASPRLASLSVEDIRSDKKLSLAFKLYLAEKQHPDIFDAVKENILNLFDYIDDLRFAQPPFLSKIHFNPVPEMETLQLKERGADQWICVWDFSSGVKRALEVVAAIELSPQNAVFLFDEVENSFGVNCLDGIVNIITSHKNTSQFILSSHHPYIINNIPPGSWRLVSRKKNVVSANPVFEDISSFSKHDEFIKLVNLKQYTDGIES